MLELIGVDRLTQWDVGRQINVDKDVDMVHFSNRPYGYSKNVKVTDGVADVPDMFLTSCAPLHIWAYIGNFEKGYTKIEKIYEVKPKNRPEDYIYTPEEVKTWEKLQSEIGDLAGLETEAKENLVAAINEAAKSGGESYTLPQATAEALGGVKADSVEAADTQPVHIGSDGKLYTAPSVTDISTKMDANNPVGTGSFSMNRKAGTVIGVNSHAEGNQTTASGQYSHAEGNYTKASGNGSHAEGYLTTASGDFSHAQGKCNIEDTSSIYADIIGNGTSDTARSNAATVDWSGNAWFAGDVYTGSTSGTNKDDGSKKLATEEYVDNSIAAGGTDISLGLTSAAVGQIIKVKAVDESGKPTAWEAAEMAGGAEHWEKIADIDLRSDTSKYVLADFGVWRKAKVIMTRPKYISGLQKNVWVRVVKKGHTPGYNCGYLDSTYGYVYWEFAAEVDDIFISSTSFDNNNTNNTVAIKSTRTLTPLDGAPSEYEFILLFTDTSVIQEGDRVTVIGVKR